MLKSAICIGYMASRHPILKFYLIQWKSIAGHVTRVINTYSQKWVDVVMIYIVAKF